jgi:hypothetical protein
MSDINVGNVSANAVGTDAINTKDGTPVMSFDAAGAVTFNYPSGLTTWTTATRPTLPVIGTYGYNTSDDSFEVWNGQFWKKFLSQSSLITTGLVMHLDAGDSASYPGTGTTWSDISGTGYGASITGGNRWVATNGGYFDFGTDSQTSDYIVMPTAALAAVGGTYTMETWLAPRTNSGNRYFHSMATSGNNNQQIYQQTASNIGVYQGSVSIPYSDGEWMQYTVVRNGSDSGLLYKNAGNPITSSAVKDNSSTEGWVLNQEQDSVLGTFDSTQNFWGAFAIVRLYNRALTKEEIQINFDANKARFGL